MATKRLMIVLAVVVIAAVAAGAYFALYLAPVPVRKVTLILDFIAYGKHAPYYVALDQGFFEEQGLEVEFITTTGSTDAAEKLIAGAGEICLTDASEVMRFRSQQGSDIKLVGMWHHVAPYGVLFLDESGIKTPKDLEGKTWLTTSGGVVHLIAPAFAKGAGFDLEKVNLLFGAPATFVPSVLAGQADVVGTFTTVFPALEALAAAEGKTASYILYADYGVDVYATGVATTDRLIKSDPDLVRRFLRAVYKGVQFGIENPEQSVDILVKYLPELKTDIALGQHRVGIDLLGEIGKQPIDRATDLGKMDESKMQRTMDILSEAMEFEPIPVKEVYTNEFLD